MFAVKRPGMFKIQFDSPAFESGPYADRIVTACEEALQASKKAINPPNRPSEDHRKNRWFGQGREEMVAAGVKIVHDIITNENITVTFVDRRGKQARPLEFCGHGAAFSGHRPIVEFGKPVPIPATRSGEAWAARAFAAGAFMAHCGSGMRIYLCQRMFEVLEGDGEEWYEAPQTVYHELTHKILGTTDFEFGVEDCLNLAIADGGKAIANADNWGYYVMSFLYEIG